MQALHVNGNNLGLDEVRQVVQERRPVLLQPEARIAVERARAVVEELLENDGVAYAVNTGVGKLADLRIPPDDIRKLQINLLRSHAAGIGEPLAEDVTRAMVLLRANSLAKGFSGVRRMAGGEATFRGQRVTAAEALKQADIEPLVLQAKEAISLINGTQGMLAVGLLATLQANILADTADV